MKIRNSTSKTFKDEVIALAIQGYDELLVGCYLSNFKDSTICNKNCKDRKTCEKIEEGRANERQSG